MERSDNRDADHIIEIEMRHDVSSTGPDRRHDEEGASSSSALPIPQSSLASSGSRQCRNMFNSGIWILIELIFTMSQILACTIVLYLSRLHDPQLFAWAIIYATGCVATLPFLYWRFLHSRVDFRIPRSLIFNLIWLTVGNMWIFIFGRHKSFTVEKPFLYMHCLMFLKFCMLFFPFVFAIICCCLPLIMSAGDFHEVLNHIGGASEETINALPRYKFKLKNSNAEGVGEGGGTLAAGTEKELIISGEDAVCSICLGKYADNEKLRVLPCSHFFHVDCVDKWLKMNSTCPLCKRGVKGNVVDTSSRSGVA
ncbi:hypothetical protein MKW98_011262 [Papaver atlanticum]|uniref:RING-type domain-containing protein n=1 Tax=Papaver atlanticum TaxID=357466 RepID=A0AAD4SVQ8_9MAGN|nr:hypothetical protein MKW98_011262 [Papaver atlanticum]